VGKEGLHARLARLDPAAAQAIDARNLRRTVRALEVTLSTGRRFSLHASRSRRLTAAADRIDPPRAELYARLDARIEAMLAAGLVEEVRGLLQRGYSPALPSCRPSATARLWRTCRGNYRWKRP